MKRSILAFVAGLTVWVLVAFFLNRGLRLALPGAHDDAHHDRGDDPHASPAAFKSTIVAPQWGETTWLWPDFRMQSNTRVILDRSGDFEENQAFSAGGWFMLRSAPYFALDNNPGANSNANYGKCDNLSS